MSFRLDADEAIPRAVRRVAHAGLDLVGKSLHGASKEGIHEARRALKRLRAMARLFRRAVGTKASRRVDNGLGKVGHLLSSARDQAVVVATYDGLTKGVPGMDAIRAALDSRRSRLHADVSHREIEARLARLRRRFDGWSFLVEDERTYLDGLRDTYRDGRRALAEVYRVGDVEALHTLRKRVKDLGYQLKLLESLLGDAAVRDGRKLTRLGRLLGEDHDLFILRAAVIDATEGTGLHIDGALLRIDRRRWDLQRIALPIAAEILARKPRVWVARLNKSDD